jgi:hypothetical protein
LAIFDRRFGDLTVDFPKYVGSAKTGEKIVSAGPTNVLKVVPDP